MFSLIGSNMRIKPVWGDLSCKLTILDESHAYYCEANRESIEKFAEQLSKDPSEYFEGLKKYILNNNEEIRLSVIAEFFSVYLIVDPIRKIKVKYFSAKVKFLDYRGTVEQWLDELNESNKLLSEDKIKNEEKIKTMFEDSTKCAKLFKDHVEKSKVKEEKLIGNFTLLLNTKKQKIQFLTEVIEANKYNLPEPKDPTEPGKETKKEILSDSESEYNTDDENTNKSGNTSSNDEIEDLCAKPGTSGIKLPPRQTRSFNFDDNIPTKRSKTEEKPENTILNNKNEISETPTTNTNETKELPETVTAKTTEQTLENFCSEEILNRLYQ